MSTVFYNDEKLRLSWDELLKWYPNTKWVTIFDGKVKVWFSEKDSKEIATVSDVNISGRYDNPNYKGRK